MNKVSEYERKKEVYDYVLMMLRNGYKQKEISEKCTICDLSQPTVSNIKYNLIIMGKITEEEIKEARKKREEQESLDENFKEKNNNVQENKMSQEYSDFSTEKVNESKNNEPSVRIAKKIKKQIQILKRK